MEAMCGLCRAHLEAQPSPLVSYYLDSRGGHLPAFALADGPEGWEVGVLGVGRGVG